METIEKISGYLLKSKCRELIENGLKLEVKGPFLEYKNLKLLNCDYALVNSDIVKIDQVNIGKTQGLTNFDYITLDLLTEMTGKEVSYKNFSKEKIDLIASEIELNPANKNLRTLLRLQARSNI